ncbi:hypothetical protein LINPERHAP1_LOCUS277 [Linum perenne]
MYLTTIYVCAAASSSSGFSISLYFFRFSATTCLASSYALFQLHLKQGT